MIDFEPTDEQRSYCDVVADFARRELAETGIGLRERWRRCARLGALGWTMPADYGGSGADTVTATMAMEALGYGSPDSGLLFGLNAQIWSVQHPLLRVGTDAQRRRYLPGLIDGSLIGAHGMTEADSGSDAFALRTSATLRGGRYVLRGSKAFVTNAPVADVFVVFATLDRRRGLGGVCAFLVERDTPGLEVGPPTRKMGLDGAPMADVHLDGCELAEDAMLGRPGGGVAAFVTAMELERSFVMTGAVGAMRRMLEDCIGYTNARRQFGRPIAEFQAVSHRLVDMRLRLETARLLLYRLAWQVDRGERIGLDSALVKLHVSESFLQSSLDAVQLHGGYGYTTDSGIEAFVRDAVAGRLYSGTSEVQRNIAARWMGVGARSGLRPSG